MRPQSISFFRKFLRWMFRLIFMGNKRQQGRMVDFPAALFSLIHWLSMQFLFYCNTAVVEGSVCHCQKWLIDASSTEVMNVFITPLNFLIMTQHHLLMTEENIDIVVSYGIGDVDHIVGIFFTAESTLEFE